MAKNRCHGAWLRRHIGRTLKGISVDVLRGMTSPPMKSSCADSARREIYHRMKFGFQCKLELESDSKIPRLQNTKTSNVHRPPEHDSTLGFVSRTSGMLIERMRKRPAADRASFIKSCLPSPPRRPRAGSNGIHQGGGAGGAGALAQACRRDRINSVATLRCHPRARPNVNDGSPQRQRSRGQCVPVLGLRSFRSPFPRASVSGGALRSMT